jgi:hypothetical protein
MKNSSKKFGCAALVIMLSLFVGVVLLLYYVFKHADKTITAEKHDYEVNINKKVIIDKDTLTVVNYSIWNSTYNLSNGATVDKEFVNGKTLK